MNKSRVILAVILVIVALLGAIVPASLGMETDKVFGLFVATTLGAVALWLLLSCFVGTSSDEGGPYRG